MLVGIVEVEAPLAVQAEAPAAGFGADPGARLDAKQVVVRVDQVLTVVAGYDDVLGAPVEDLVQIDIAESDQVAPVEAAGRFASPVPVGIHDHLIAAHPLFDAVVCLEAVEAAAVVDNLPRRIVE